VIRHDRHTTPGLERVRRLGRGDLEPATSHLAVQVLARIEARASIAAVPGERCWQLLIGLSSVRFS
jgi:hypothetical protein